VKTNENEEWLLLRWLWSKLKIPFRKFRLLFKNDWTWRLFVVLQIFGFIGIAYYALTNEDRWSLFPHQPIYTDDPCWDLLNSTYWTEHHENWLAFIFFFGPFVISKATDSICAAKKKTPPRQNWKNN
jgi:hypothetical protein